MTLVVKLVMLAAVAATLLSAAALAQSQSGAEPTRPVYPKSRVDAVVEAMHGVEVADPYRWLEATDSAEVQTWIATQNQFTRAMLDKLPVRASIRKRLNELLTVGTISTPTVRGRRYFYTKREGRQNQPILFVRDGVDGEDRMLLDPNTLAADGTVALDWWHPSRDGKLLAYGTSEGGSEKSTLCLVEVDSGRLRPDTIPFTRACSIAWLPDSSGFYYTRYPTPGTVAQGEENYYRHVFFHRVGDAPEDDVRVFGAGRAPQDWPNLDISPDGRWLLVTMQQGWAKSEIYLSDLAADPCEFQPVVQGVNARFTGEMQNDRLYVHTNWEAPRYRVFAVDPSRLLPLEQWRVLIPERDSVLERIAVIGGRLIAHSLRDASSRLEVFSLDGKPEREVELPMVGSLAGLGGEWNGDEAFFGFTSFAIPPAIYRIEINRPPTSSDSSGKRRKKPRLVKRVKAAIASSRVADAVGEPELWQRVTAPIDPSDYAIKQVRCRSKDGTEVPMFIVHAAALELDANRPTVLYGYGGFNVNQTPSFIAHLPLWLDAGGVFCVANLRGGGEYGESWHQAGMLGNKQNVFDDFISAAEWLIENGYSNRDRLAVSGGSNGGLLVAAALTQRPELFRAVVCRVPLLDMLRYQHFRIAKLWIPEYGAPEDPEQFRWLYAYSPYHRVRDGVAYPSVLLTTAEGDSRVDPMHAFKTAARLQAASSSDRPVLLRVESKAGHGAGKPLAKTIDEQTDIWAFLFWQLGV